jgi:hypothetical protein
MVGEESQSLEGRGVRPTKRGSVEKSIIDRPLFDGNYKTEG